MRSPYPVTIALEGGGSFGAFTWGVLERLLDVPALRIEVVSGASAGAMNAAMMVQGLSIAGPQQAKRELERFWRRVAAESVDLAFSFRGWMDIAGRLFAETMRRNGLRPQPAFTVNPLRAILDDLLDVASFRQPHAPRLVVSATRVRTGESRLFTNDEIGVDVLLGSACLPTLFPTVQIGGEAYWDGGFSSNPPLRPLIEAGAPSDVIIVRTTPLERPDIPSTGAEVAARTTELAFGAALRQELRSLAVAQRMLKPVPFLPMALARLRDARIHMIGAEAEFRSLPTGRRLETTWSFLSTMRGLGNEAATAWLSANLESIGRRSTIAPSLFEGSRLDELDQGAGVARLRRAAFR
jgi:NTE family protein